MFVINKKLLKTIKYKLNKTYRSNSLQENFPSVVGKEVSYNVNKGEVISICLRNYNNPDEFHDLNDLIFVTIHEIAHSCNESYGHDKKFWKIFRILLEVAVENNIYKNINYQNNFSQYCSMKITYNPIFDKSLDDISYFQ
jgi:predicted metal-dependent hydrolase